MTEKLRIRLFNSPPILLGIVLIPLVCFFLYAFVIDQTVFNLLIFGLVLILVYLLPIKSKLRKLNAEAELRKQGLIEKINLCEAGQRKEEQAIVSFREKIVNSSQLKGLTERLSMCLYLEDTSKSLSDEVHRLFGDDESTIILYLFHSKTGKLGISSSQKGEMRINLKSKNGDLFDQWVVKTMQPLLIEDIHSDFRFDSERLDMDDLRPLRSLISVPLMIGDKALGILRVDSQKVNKFSTEDLRFLQTISGLGSVAIENAQLYEHVEQLAIRDGLTNLYLRRYLLERMSEEIARHLRRKTQLSFLMIDLDKFKEYNDKFGHAAGDIVLRSVSMLLSNSFKDPGNLVCRYGGEEFCVLLPHCSKKKAVELAEIFRKKISEQTILLRREKTKMTVSIGVATFPKDAQVKEELIHEADKAMYQAKLNGRNQVFSN